MNKNLMRSENIADGLRRWLIPVVATLALTIIFAPVFRPQQADAAAAAVEPTAPDKLAFLLTTGLEDPTALDLVLQYAIAARASGRVSQAVILADGRGVEVLAARLKARPSQTAELAKQAKAAGVRFVIVEAGLTQDHLTKADLDPVPDEIISAGGARLADLIAQHYEILHF